MIDENNKVVVDGNVEDVCSVNFDKVGDQAIAVTKIIPNRSNIDSRDVIFFMAE